MTLKVGIVGPLPPAKTGPATYVARQLPWLAAAGADVTLLVDEPLAVDPVLRRSWPVRAITHRASQSLDVVLYHVANNPFHRGVFEAARSGPPGLIVLHDGSLHHLLSGEVFGVGDYGTYENLLAEGHGDAGRELARIRRYGSTAIELFLYDVLGSVLHDHLGVLVHNRFAGHLVTRRSPGLPVHLVPHFAMPPAAVTPRQSLGIPAGRFLVGHFGFITRPKRFDVLCRAIAGLVRRGIDVHLLVVGDDHSHGEFAGLVDELNIGDRVTVTGWVDDDAFERLLGTVDAAVSLRWPHVGEASGTLAGLLAAGVAVVADSTGPWAEMPPDVVVHLGGGDDPADECANALAALALDPEGTAERQRKARAFAETVLAPDRCAGLVVEACQAAIEHRASGRHRLRPSREAAVQEFLDAGLDRLGAALLDTGSAIAGIIGDGHLRRYHASLATLPPAAPGATLVDIGSFPPLLRVLHEVWGYEVQGCTRAEPANPGPKVVDLAASAGLPAARISLLPCDLEWEPLPFATASADVVTCWEVIEHLGHDPMNLLVEVNRILGASGMLHLTTPNLASAASVRAILEGRTPSRWPHFLLSGTDDRHNREYTPDDLAQLLELAGLATDDISTTTVWDDVAELEPTGDPATDPATPGRGDCIIVRSRKVGLPVERFPSSFYA